MEVRHAIRKVSELVVNPKNPRVLRDKRFKALKESIEQDPKMMEAERICVSMHSDRLNMIVMGNQRYQAVKSLGWKEVPVTELYDGTEEEEKRWGLKSNLHFGEHDWDMLANEYDLDFLKAAGFDDKEMDKILGSKTVPEEEIARKLSERFGVPPMSILDARQGYWQERKDTWLKYGIESEVGRGNHQTYGKFDDKKFSVPMKKGFGVLIESPSGRDPSFYPQKIRAEARLGRALSTEEFEKEHYEDKNEGGNLSQSGTSVFDPVLCELAYRWFSQEGATVLDPFAGGSVRGIVASLLNRKYVGIELRAEQVEANRIQADKICKKEKPTWHTGDSLKVKEIADSEYDFIFSCPPYADLEVYSDDPQDLSNMEYSEFLKAYRSIIKDSCSMLKDDRFACFVVGEVREKKGNGEYKGFVMDTIQAFEEAGLQFYNEAILITPMGSLPIRVGRQFETSRKLGKTHQNVLIFLKGNIKETIKAIGSVDFSLSLEDSNTANLS